ncbi:CMP-N-acetlyneuraminic acid synthetase [Thermoanaerobacterium sp. PSU-2]|uniref:acylneuraminate cytidylyltransferase family protein n=1 Tax=Thermoanaerobacterium sp. PSU-2 TaxID=1930849 RepID=UPI000A15625B|nr:acylneuraminate cytidylyltransferase family protein [Thermoanaerobacterium sp. PSU-2]ORX24521.1 CMP-N-acetlyneuraminic acid synthetase [Thermoanaerobacterium sp. PSU-2]
MYKGKSILAIIPARGGSKGVKRKNVRPLLNRPLIAYTIEAALQANFLDKIIVSTEDPEIASISKEFGAEIPFMRPVELASDDAKAIDVIFHAMNWLEKNHAVYDLVMLLQPTSPLRKAYDIKNAIDILYEKKARAVVSVCEAEHSPLWMNVLNEDLCMKDFLRKDVLNKNRQEISKYYRINGAIYVSDWNYLIQNKGFFGEKTYAYIMPNERSIDIDTELDLKFAEFLMNNFHIQK